jgi:hypothetical protein
VYDLQTDPGQTKNLYAASDPLSAKLASHFEESTAKAAEHAGHGSPMQLTEEQRAKLASLGYASGRSANSATPTLDPKDVIDIADQIDRAKELHESARFDRRSPSPTRFSENLRTGPRYLFAGRRFFRNEVTASRKGVRLGPVRPPVSPPGSNLGRLAGAGDLTGRGRGGRPSTSSRTSPSHALRSSPRSSDAGTRRRRSR